MDIKWDDTTSYNRADTERVASIWSLSFKGVRLVVHRILKCDGWYMSVHGDIQINNEHLGDIDIEDAKNESIDMLLHKLDKLFYRLSRVKNSINEGVNNG